MSDVPSSVPVAAPRRTVRLLDIPVTRVRRPADLVLGIVSVLGIVALLALSVYAHGTTAGVQEDVKSAFAAVVRTLLLLPVNVIEGLLYLVLPVVVLVERLVRGNWRAVGEAVASAAAAFGATLALTAGLTAWASPDLLGGLLIGTDTGKVLSISPAVAALAALLTVTGSRASNKILSVSWTLMWISLVVSIITGDGTIIGALVSVLAGRAMGLFTRYASGVLSERAHGVVLVEAIQRAGVDPVSVVRLGEHTDAEDLRIETPEVARSVGYPVSTEGLDILPVAEEAEATPARRRTWRELWANAARHISDEAPTQDVHEIIAETQDPATVAVEREGYNRVYAVEDGTGTRWDAVVLDEDRQVIGMLSQLWTAIRLRGIGRRSAVTLRQAAERAALMSYAALEAGVHTPRLRGVADTGESVVLLGEHVDGARAFAELGPEEITDEVLGKAWAQLLTAHEHGLSHRALGPDAVLLVSGGPHDGEVYLSGWEQGEIASSTLTSRIDMFQLLAMTSFAVGVDRAVAAAQRVLPEELLAGLAALVQRVALPPDLQAAARADKSVLRDLRAKLATFLPESAPVVEPMKITRFSTRTVVMVTIAVVAGYVLLTQLNFGEVMQQIAQANFWWLGAAFALGLLTYLGAAMGLVAFSPQKIGLWKTTLVQIAASVVSIVAPAGVGPAALNLRYLQKQKLDTPMAVTTVTLLQLSQFVTTLGMLLGIALFTGSSGALAALPSGTIVVVLVVVVGVVGVGMAIPAVRRWVIGKIAPTLRQVWPRLLWVLGQPRRLIMGLGGNLLQTAGYLLAFAASLAAFGQSLPPTTLAIVFLTGTTVGSAVPTPGGIGAVEAAFTIGLRGAGIATGAAVSTANAFRLATFWARIPLGWAALQFLQKRGEL